MHLSQIFLSEFEGFLRGIIREGIREAQSSSLPTAQTISQSRDRIGGISLAEEITGFARQTLYNLASRRKIPHSKRDGKLIFSEVELREWLVENKRPMSDGLAGMADQFIAKPTSRRRGKKGL